MLEHIEGGYRVLCQLPPPLSLEGKHEATRHEDREDRRPQLLRQEQGGPTANPFHVWQGHRPSTLRPAQMSLETHVHDVCALVEDLHVGLQDVKVESRCEQAAVSAPLVPFAEQKSIP